MKYPKKVWITRDTIFDTNVEVFDAEFGVKKLSGCISYWPMADNKLSFISMGCCRRRFGSVPKREECWLVEQKKNHVLWTRYDHLYKIGEVILT